VWLDAFVSNPDRTHRNPNLLIWNRKPWLIDHGAALYAHHDWPSVDVERMRSPFPLIKDHVLLSRADDIESVDKEFSPMLTSTTLERIVSQVPDALLRDKVIAADFPNAEAARARYVEYLTTRIEAPRPFVSEAVEARGRVKSTKPRRMAARR
jgi:hypothetical protein